MNEFFKNRIDTAHALIDERMYDDAVELLQNIKTRIHDAGILSTMNQHDSDVDKEYNKQYATIGTQTGDPYESYSKVVQLKRWKAQEYLKFYDKTLREHEL